MCSGDLLLGAVLGSLADAAYDRFQPGMQPRSVPSLMHGQLQCAYWANRAVLLMCHPCWLLFVLRSELGGTDLTPMSLGLSHSLSRYKLKFSPEKVDTMIVQVGTAAVCWPWPGSQSAAAELCFDLHGALSRPAQFCTDAGRQEQPVS